MYNEAMKRMISFLLCCVILLGNIPVVSFATETDDLCEHHAVHEDCGYEAGVNDCGYACEMCIQVNGETTGPTLVPEVATEPEETEALNAAEQINFATSTENSTSEEAVAGMPISLYSVSAYAEDVTYYDGIEKAAEVLRAGMKARQQSIVIGLKSDRFYEELMNEVYTT